MEILDAFEFLLDHNFEPKRTIIAGFGFDEEIRHLYSFTWLICSGGNGAAYISSHLLERYGKDSVEFIIDEGGSDVRHMYGTTFALPGTAEKVIFPR
jgi:Gly-Xaa carboxypeptidase